MKPVGWQRILAGILLLVALTFTGFAGEKTIHLRNETIRTAPPQRRRQAQPAEKPVSGLFLVQFTEAFQEGWRVDLAQKGVKILRYVPDDAFIARLEKTRISDVESLPFVQWVGVYKPEHKIHPSLSRAKNKQVAPAVRDIRILLAPDAPQKEVARLHRLLKASRESHPRFGSILDTSVTPAQLNALATMPSVLWIEPRRPMKLLDEIASKIVGGDTGTNGTRTVTQQRGFDGTGITVAVADSGLDSGDNSDMHPDLAGRVDALFQYGSLTDAADEHSHGTHVTGIIAGNAATGEVDDYGNLYGLGVAPGAHVIAQRIFDGTGNYEAPPSYEVLTHDAVRAGAKVGSNSWGDDTQGQYDLSAAEFDELVRDADAGTPGDQPYVLEFSAGNAGPGAQTMDSPAVAKNVIATGAAENDRFDFGMYDSGQDTMADFSSRGPCEDGRIKPDVTAPGTWIASLRSVYANDENAWGGAPISENYMYQGGTSQAGPHASGAAAVFMQYYRQTVTNSLPSPALVKAALINCAVDMDDSQGTAPVPNSDEGWGRIDLTQLIGSTRRYEYVDQRVPLTNGQVFEKSILVADSNESLKITLAYTDVPGLPAAIPALVNDLDLEVIGPNGASYKGNQFENGESVPNAPSFDNINNVEAVHLSVPLPGEYLVRIHAQKVVEDALQNVPGINQDFALVASADLPLPGSGVLFFDRAAYSAPDTIRLKLVDFDLSAATTVSIHLASSTETNAETIVLSKFSAGTFTGSVATVIGTALPDGRLQIAHGDTIAATYSDAAPAGIRTATARADLVPPVITAVLATNAFGEMVVTWHTDESATSVVHYGTNSSLGLGSTNFALVTEHTVEIGNLTAGTNYWFLVASSDEAGNTSTNNNNGSLFQFTAQAASVVLFVDAYVPVDGDPSAIVPRSAYTDALDQSGVSYEVWDTSQRGSPAASNLRPFRVVIWRINDSLFGDATIDAAQQTVLRDYLTNGGALFISSMELLSRIGTNATALAFRTNVLQARSFVADAGVPLAEGMAGEPITTGLNLPLSYDSYDSDFLQLFGIDPDVADTLTVTTNASPIFLDGSGQVAGLRYPKTGVDAPGRVVFLSFPFDAVSSSDADPNNRANLMRNILAFLTPGASGLGSIVFDKSVYTIPSRITVEVADSDLAGLGQTTVTFFSSTATNGQVISLSETPRRGLFRGFIATAAATNAFKAGELRVQNGDRVWAEYLDASANGIVRADAAIDTSSPIISNVAVTADYEEATVTWTTSKPSDGLVQFGESAFFNRTAYHDQLTANHSLTLSGLQPDHLYYFQIASRDTAGNRAVDDNNGRFYTVHTLVPFTAPWFDNFENSRTNWIILDGEAGTTTWQLGTPNDGMVSDAHSPTNAWASNLNGNFIDVGDTTLAGPAVDLRGGTRATLRFWQAYDFTSQSDMDIYEYGQVCISTNGGNDWTVLSELTESSYGWEEAEFDLTPYLNHVIRVGFYYGFFSFEAANHPGWVIDDLSITVSNAATGTIEVTNNLAQASFSVSGPLPFSGSAWNTMQTYAPTGQYIATWNPVPFYTTPAPQTNALNPGALLLFSGNYTFIDANNNGISDAWEQQFFGAVSTNRTRFTDTDGDGVTDFGEFIAGTNPTNTSSALRFATPVLLTNNSLRLSWNSTTNRAYQVQGSSNALSWLPVSSWLLATNTNSVFLMMPLTNGAPYLFRLEVKP